jgi:predicted MFS family arabinose efflux permease
MRATASRRAALLALSLACFISVTSENLPVALIPQLAPDFDVSASAIGYLVSGYAVVVALTAIPFVSLTAGWDRRQAAMLTIAAVAAANLLFAVAPTYPVAVVARVIAALGHGVFWSIVAPIAARLAGHQHAGRATATVFAGNAMAMILGLPLASALGSTVGWRLSVVVMAVVAAVAALAIRLTIPPMPSHNGRTHQGAHGVRTLAHNTALLAVVAATLLLVFGHFSAWTYVTLIIDRYAHVHGSGVSVVLFANGVAGLIGVLLIRRAIDSRPRRTSAAVAAWLGACMDLLLIVGPHSPIVAVAAVILWALSSAGIAIVLQSAVLRAAAAAQDLASATYVVAFQVGIALGAGLGGWFVERRALPATIVVAAACAALVVAIILRSRTAFPASPTRTDSNRPAVGDQASNRRTSLFGARSR